MGYVFLILGVSSLVVLVICVIIIYEMNQCNKFLKPKSAIGNLFGILFEVSFKNKCKRKLTQMRNTPIKKRRRYYKNLEEILERNIKQL